jgi:molecular chaperone DnaJ
VVQVAGHKTFERRGDDLYVALDIGITQAALGATMPVPSLDGEARVEIPHGTQTGSLFRVRGKGMRRLGSKHCGDLYVVAKVVTPTDLTDEQKQLLRRFQDCEDERMTR